MIFVLPVLALVVCFCLVVMTCHRQHDRIVELETALQLQVLVQELGKDSNVCVESLSEARRTADEAAKAALETQEVL